MAFSSSSSVSGRWLRIADVAVVLWTATWIVVGLSVATQIRGLTQLSTTVVVGGRALKTTALGLDSLQSVPFIGSGIHDVAGRVDQAGDSAIASGRDSRDRTRSLAVLLGLAVGVVPTVPLLAVYTPLRLSRAREARAIRRALRTSAGDPAFEQYLARRAIDRLPYARLKAISDDPWKDIELGSYRALADAELARLGLERPRSAPMLVRTASSSGGYRT
jgi:hypothetical protein